MRRRASHWPAASSTRRTSTSWSRSILASGKILAKYGAPGAVFLNHVAADAQGNVYVSDSNTSTIWRLAGSKFEKWLEGPELKFPNGLYVDGDKLIVAAWGAPGTSAHRRRLRTCSMSLADKKISDLGDGTPVGNLDGIEPIGDDFLVTDWVAGALPHGPQR